MSKYKQAPNLYRLEDLQQMDNNSVTKVINNRWVPARPLGYDSLRSRLKLAWMVFTGKADVVVWPEGQ